MSLRLDNLSFVLQHYLPLPDDLSKCKHRTTQQFTNDAIKSKESNWYKSLPCGSSEEWLSLPYQVYSNDNVIVAPTLLSVPDVDYIRVNKHILVISSCLEEAKIENLSEYMSIYQMKSFPKTHEGYVVLELVYFTNKTGGSCHLCGSPQCGSLLEDLLTLGTKKDGRPRYCLPSQVREVNKQGTVQGPAFSTAFSDPNWGVFSTDHVDSVFCPQWPFMAEEWVTRERHSNWPSASQVETISTSGCYVVPMGHHKSPLPQYEWRVSFSQAEVLLARSLTAIHRKCYMIVKTLLKTKLKDPDILSTYHLKTLMFWRCERTPQDNWTESNMASHVLGLLDSLEKSLSTQNIPHYFIPKHNLIDHLDPHGVNIMMTKVQEVRHEILDSLLQSFITLMPCCVRGHQALCVKDIFATILDICGSQKDLHTEDKRWFLQELAHYYFLLGRYDLFTDLIHHSFEYDMDSKDKTVGEMGLAVGKSQKPRFHQLLHDALKLSPNPETAYSYVLWSIGDYFRKYDIISLTEAREEMIRLRYSFLPKDSEFQKIIYDSFKNCLFEFRAENFQNPRSSAVISYIFLQMGEDKDALSEAENGLKLLEDLQFDISQASDTQTQLAGYQKEMIVIECEHCEHLPTRNQHNEDQITENKHNDDLQSKNQNDESQTKNQHDESQTKNQHTDKSQDKNQHTESQYTVNRNQRRGTQNTEYQNTDDLQTKKHHAEDSQTQNQHTEDSQIKIQHTGIQHPQNEKHQNKNKATEYDATSDYAGTMETEASSKLVIKRNILTIPLQSVRNSQATTQEIECWENIPGADSENSSITFQPSDQLEKIGRKRLAKQEIKLPADRLPTGNKDTSTSISAPVRQFERLSFYKVHEAGLCQIMRNALKPYLDRQPLTLPTKFILLFIKYRCAKRQNNGETVEINKADMVKMSEDIMFNSEEREIMKTICHNCYPHVETKPNQSQ